MVALAAALCACSSIQGVLQSGPTAAAAPAVPGELAEYLAELRGMSEARLASEAAAQRQNAARHPGDAARLKAALALTLLGRSDEGEILALVDPVVRSGMSREAQGMASFLQAIATERRRLKESAAAANTRIKDERRAAEQQKQRADALQERATQLQQKLDALSELEKSLSDREPPNR